MVGIFFLVVLLILLILSGFIITRTITLENNRLILLPVSQIIGVSLYIFLLNITSKIFYGKLGIILSLLGLTLLTFYLYIKYRRQWIKLNPIPDNQKLITLLIIFIVVIFSFYKMFTILPTGDSSMQWAYAASFARGNYPLMTPWQPDLIPNYHLGAYFFEGALFSLTGVSFLLIHTFFNTFLLIAGILMVLFILWKNKGFITNFWAIISVLIFFVSFGVIMIILPNFSSHIQIIEFSKLKDIIPTKGTAGASLVDLSGLSYLPARSLSLSLVLVILYFIKTTFKKNFLKILTISALLSVCALVEESIFLPLMLVLASIFIMSCLPFLPKISYIAKSRRFLILIIAITTISVVFQGGFLTNKIFSKQENTSFYKLISPLSNPNFLPNEIFRNFYLNAQSPLPYTSWFVPTPLLLVLALIIYSYLKKDPVVGLTGLFALISFALFRIVEYEPCPECSARFLSFGNIASGFGISLIVSNLLKNLSTKISLVFLFIFITFVLIPTISPDIHYEYKIIRQGIKNGEVKTLFAVKNSIPWLKNLIPANGRVIVIDSGFPSPGGSLDFQYNGIYTILGPQHTRVIRPQPGIEFFDLALTLNSSLLIKTKTNYVFIDSNSIAYQQLPQFRKEDLLNSSFFNILYSESKDNTGRNSFMRLYKVLPQYLDPTVGGKEINDRKLDKLKIMIPKDAKVYLSDYGDSPDSLSFWYRMALQYALKDHNLIMNLSQTAYQVIETDFNRRFPKEGEVFNYYILAPNQKPDFEAELIWSNVLASAWKRI